MKKFSISLLTIFIVICLPIALFVSTTPMLIKGFGDDSLKIAEGQRLGDVILNGQSEGGALIIDANDIDNLSKWLSVETNSTQILLSVNKYGLSLVMTRKIAPYIPLYINSACIYSSYQKQLHGEGCAVGNIMVANQYVEKAISLFDNANTGKLLLEIIKNAQFLDSRLLIALPVADNSTVKNDFNAHLSSGSASVIETKVKTVKPVQYSEKVLLEKHHLELVGGFKIPRIKHNRMRFSARYIDNLPGTGQWVLGHPDGFVVLLNEPGALGTGSPPGWPLMTEARRVKVLHNVRKLGPTGVLFHDENTVIASGRKSYRSGFEAEWLAKVKLDTNEETRYQIVSKTNSEYDNFHLMQSLGGGFMRVTDDKWSAKNLNGVKFLLGRGGYDVLGSPLGPSLGLWNGTNEAPIFLLDFPKEYPARRDPYYTYPDIDPNTYKKAKLPMWKMPDNDDGFWQAGDVGGIAFVNHPSVKGVVVTHNFGRGVHDYRAQGDIGSGKYFLVADPIAFYSDEGIEKGDRAAHSKEKGNQAYPKGLFARGAQVYEPEHLSGALTGQVLPHDAKSKRFDWPRAGIDWSDDVHSHTHLGSILWDNERQLLWLVFGSLNQTYVAAYSINPNNSPSTQEQEIPTSWLKEFEQSKSLESSLKGIIN